MAPLRAAAGGIGPQLVPSYGGGALRFDHPDPAARRAAVVARGGDPDAVGALLDRFAVEDDAFVRDALATRLAGHDVDPVAQAMAAALRHPGAAVRSYAVHVLATTRESTRRVLPGLLADPDRDVRALVVMVLARTEDPDALDRLRAVAATDPDPVVVSAALSEVVERLGAGAVDDARAAAARFPDDPYVGFALRQAGDDGDRRVPS